MTTQEPTGRPRDVSDEDQLYERAGDIEGGQPSAVIRRLAHLVEFERIRRNLTWEEVSTEIGFTSDRYLYKLQRGFIDWKTAGLERLRLVAKWLGIAPVEAFKLAEVITLEDFVRESPGDEPLDQLLHRMSLDPRYSILFEEFEAAQQLPRWAKYALLVTYQELTGQLLLATATQLNVEHVTIEDIDRLKPRKRKRSSATVATGQAARKVARKRTP